MTDDEIKSLTEMYTFLHNEDCFVYDPQLSSQFSQLQLHDQKPDSRYSQDLLEWVTLSLPSVSSKAAPSLTDQRNLQKISC